MDSHINEIESIEALDKVFAASSDSPVLIFKHSTTCPISTSVFTAVREFSGIINLITVQTSRNLSNEVAARTAVKHESPQAIVIKDGKAVYSASHFDVSVADIERSIKDA